MGIVNKRNAVLGWVTWKVGKGVAKKKAKDAIPHKSQQHKRRTPALIAGAAAAAGSVLVLKRKRKGKGGEGQPD